MQTSATSISRRMAATILALTLLVSAAVSTMAQDEISAVGSGGLVEVPEAGFALTLPLDWTYVRPQVSDLDNIMFALADVEPEFAQMV